MGAAHGPTAPVLTRLQRDIQHYSLYQALLRLMDQLQLQHPTLGPQALYRRISFSANPSLGFATRDIEQLTFEQRADGLHCHLQLNLIALSGAASPLPASYVEQALGEDAGSRSIRDLLDLFNDRLQRLLLPIWQKYRYYSRFQGGASDQLSQRLLATAGLDCDGADVGLEPRRLLPYLGLIGMRSQSAELVCAVLRYYFRYPHIELEQCLAQRIEIPPEQLCQLGQHNSTLASDCVLGNAVVDGSGRFRVHLRQLDWNDFHRFLPPGQDHAPLCALLRFVLRTPLQYDLQLQLRRDELRELRIGQRNPCHLGWTRWLGEPEGDALIRLAPNRRDTAPC